MYAVTAEGTNILVNRFVPHGDVQPLSLLSANGSQFCTQLATVAFQLLGNYTNSRQAPITLVRMTASILSTKQWHECSPLSAMSIKRTKSPPSPRPIRLQIGRLPRLPLTVFDQTFGGAHQSVDRGQLVCCDLTHERQLRAREFI